MELLPMLGEAEVKTLMLPVVSLPTRMVLCLNKLSKKFFLALVFLFCTQAVFSQQLKAHAGPEIKYENQEFFAGFLDIKGDTLISILGRYEGRNKPLGLRLMYTHKDSLGTIRFEKVKTRSKDDSDISLRYLATFKSGNYAFGSKKEKSLSKNRFVGFLIGNDSLETELATIETYSEKRKGEFYLSQSPNNELVVVVSEKPFERLGSENLEFLVLGDSLKPLIKHSIPLKYKREDYKIHEVAITNDSTTFLLLEYYYGIQRIDNKVLPLKYILLEIPADAANIVEYALAFEDRGISNITMGMTDTALSLVGLTTKNRKVDFSSSLFYMNINYITNIIQRGLLNYPSPIITHSITQKATVKGNEIRNLQIRNFTKLGENRTLLIEEKYDKEMCYTDPRTGVVTCNMHYYCNDAYALQLNPSGKLEEVFVHPKKQYSFNDGGEQLSSLLIENPKAKGGGTLVFNDHIKNVTIQELDKKKIFDRSSKGAIYCTDISSDTKYLLFDSGEYDGFLIYPAYYFAKDVEQFAIISKSSGFRIIKFSP